MNLVTFGKIVNTHGIKGELRILSNFEYKDRVLKPGFKIIVNNDEYTIESYRPHKQFDMITLKGFNNINDVLFLKGRFAYIDINDLRLQEDEILTHDLLGFEVYDDTRLLGEVSEIEGSNGNVILVVTQGERDILIPKVDAFIKNIDQPTKRIDIHHWEGLE